MNKNTKLIIIIAVVALGAFLVYQRVVNGDKIDARNEAREAEELGKQNAELLIQSQKEGDLLAAISVLKKEQKVKEVILIKDTFYVAVDDDGTDRKGLAEYFCQVVKEQNVLDKHVQIVKTGSYTDSTDVKQKSIFLGRSLCI
jgi:hypothetical protein